MKFWKLASAATATALVLSTSVNAAIIHLDFTTYTTNIDSYVGGTSSNFNYSDEPIVSDYRITLDTSSMHSYSSSTAYSGSTTYNELLGNSFSHQDQPHPQYGVLGYFRGNLTQEYQQLDIGGSIISEMTETYNFSYGYEGGYAAERVYTGDLPPDLVPDPFYPFEGNIDDGYIIENRNMRLSLERFLGTSSEFVMYDNRSTVNRIESIIGESFSFRDENSSYFCPEEVTYIDHWGCGWELDQTNITFSGDAVLSSVTVVPIPQAVWLFGSGLIGLIGVARRKRN